MRIMLKSLRPGLSGHIKLPRRQALRNQKDTNDIMIANSVAWP